MRKKVFKYIKFLVSMVLILGLIAPSYASLSASDGSAFVTKAEFDSALADINSRLTTFEAGINSKIDSQVTSYLDRNGIWNGKEQNLVFSDSEPFGFQSSTQEETVYVHSFAGSSRTSGSFSQWLPIPPNENQTIIEKINKSGLLWFNITLKSIFNSTNGLGTIRWGSDSNDYYAFNNLGQISLGCSFSSLSKGVSKIEWSWSKIKQSTGGAQIYSAECVDETYPVNFFVSSGDSVLFSSIAYKSGQIGGLWGVKADNDKWQYSLHVNSAQVY